MALAIAILVGCAGTSDVSLTPPPTLTDTPLIYPSSTPTPQRAPLLRIAIFGEATTTNVWALFDEAGANYWNYVTQASYWPRLYQLAPPSLDFEPATAKGMPSPLICGADFCTATVTLQPNLTWTNGSPFTAEDVAFTVNTSLQFRLALNWQQAYNPKLLDHVKAQDGTTVKYYFKGMPTVADWQFGALQGPIVNQAYWQPRIDDAVSLLPDENLLPTIQELEREFDDLQTQVDDLNFSLNTMAPASTVYQDTSKKAIRFQEELNSIANKIDKYRAEYESKLLEAREALFVLANANEPTLGAWRFSSRIDDQFENLANLGTPFGDPWFDRVRYITYPNELAAVQALENNEVDLILIPDGLLELSISLLENIPSITLSRTTSHSVRFLAFNHTNPYLAKPALHQALACMIDLNVLSEKLGDNTAPLPGFVLDDPWRAEENSLPCTGVTKDIRLEHAVAILKGAGYSWNLEPAPNSAGTNFSHPDGNTMPGFTLLVSEDDPLRVKAVKYIAQQANLLGLSLEVHQSDPDDLLYSVYGSGDYDLALLGWHLSTYPSYLCDWFTPANQNPFAYNGSKLNAECESWNATSDLDKAKNHVVEIQSILMQDLPIIPLYAAVHTDFYQNIYYPFDDILDGLSRLYGAPTLAIPIN